MEKQSVLRIPRSDDPASDVPEATALAVVDQFVERWKKMISEIDYGAAGIQATIHAGRVVKMDLTRQTRLDHQL